MLDTRPKTPSGIHSSVSSAIGYFVLSRIMDTLPVIQMSMDLPLSLGTISPGDGVQGMAVIDSCSVGIGVIGCIVNSATWVNLLLTSTVPVAKSGERVRSMGCGTFAAMHPTNNVTNNAANRKKSLLIISLFSSACPMDGFNGSGWKVTD